MLANKIKNFQIDIYKKYNHNLQEDYYKIMGDFSNLVDEKFPANQEMTQLKNELLQHFEKLLGEEDFVVMADELITCMLPIIEDIGAHGNE